jgi:hypothetical protein
MISKFFSALLLILALTLACTQQTTEINASSVEIIHTLEPEWISIAAFKNTHQLGCELGSTDLNRYGLPYYLQADEHGIVALLRRTVAFQYNTGLVALDWEGNTIWEINSRPDNADVFGIFTLEICADSVIAYTRDPTIVRVFDRFTGDSINAHAVPIIVEDYRSGCFQKMAIGNSRIVFSSYFSTGNYKLFYFDLNYNYDSIATDNAFSQGVNNSHALASIGDRYFIGGFDNATVTMCNEFGDVLDKLSLGYERIKPERLYLGDEYLSLRTPIVGTGAFSTDSSEIWIIDLENNHASVIPFSYSVSSFATFGDRMVINKTHIHYNDGDNWNQAIIEEETELCVALIE